MYFTKQKFYPDLNLLTHQITFKNGFKILIVPRQDFQEKQVMLSVGFGSIDKDIKIQNNCQTYPLGLAHFLEHKLFESVNGEDILAFFSEIGAEANAFTSYNETVFYFSSVQNLNKGIKELLDLVKNCHLTEQSVNNEKNIIKNELLMYKDDIDYQLTMGLLSNLYPESALSVDIAGNIDSITAITSESLMENHNYFYQPANMKLIMVGDINIDETVNYIDELIDIFENSSKGEIVPVVNSTLKIMPVIPANYSNMFVKHPKLGIGYRIVETLQEYPNQVYRIGLELLLALLFGWTSSTYQKWYAEGTIDYTFDFEIEVSNRFTFVMFFMDTEQPMSMTTKIKQIIKQYNKISDFNESHLDILKKEMYGNFLQTLDSIDTLATQITIHLSNKEDYLKNGKIIKNITLNDITKIAQHFIDHMETTSFTIFPK